MTDELTVIIVSLLGRNSTERCLSAVTEQADSVLVVQRDGSVTSSSGDVIGRCSQSSIPGKRQEAVMLAKSPTVALLEDTVVPTVGWADAVRKSLAAGAAACGGPVQISRALPASTRAFALSEYGTFAQKRIAGPISRLPGCNFAFRRDILLEKLDGLPGLVDLDVFHRLSQSDCTIRWAPEMEVRFSHAFPEGARLKTRFNHGRLYASSSTAGAGVAIKALAAAKSLVLPAVLTARALGPTFRDKCSSPSTIAWIMLQSTAWAAGEFAGAVAGAPPKGFNEWK